MNRIRTSSKKLIRIRPKNRPDPQHWLQQIKVISVTLLTELRIARNILWVIFVYQDQVPHVVEV
jgi:hypothetical protein